MSDELVSGLLQEADLRVLLVTSTQLSREAARLHGTAPASGAMLAQALTSAALLEGLRKDQARINVQIECDGPLRGLFVDADHGNLRGYVKNSQVAYAGNPNAFRWRPVLGNGGFLSVLRDQGGGDVYRSSVKLEALELDLDLERYFDISDQLPAAVFLEVLHEPAEPLGAVAGMIIQPLPDGDLKVLKHLKESLREASALRRAMEANPSASATDLLRAVLKERSDLDVMETHPVQYRCTCSVERVHRALLAMGKAELQSLHDEQGHAEVGCEFCGRQYVVPKSEVARLLVGDA